MSKTKTAKTAITPTREEDFPEWYQEAVYLSEMAEHAAVRGCMIVKPYGFSVWENIQSVLDKKFKKLGVQNAYFPLFIPLSFLEKEAKHVEGFSKESAVVTHTRLEKSKEGKLVPVDPLEEPLIVRPTSEMIIGASFAKWIQSYRDLPLLINQWCNVVRWEMRPRLFLRTSEFLWQEGHTAHVSEEEAKAFAKQMLGVYADFVQDYLAIPTIRGEKSAGERFPGAENTHTFEAMMQDGKALQMGTSHFMGTNFAKASAIQYLAPNGALTYAHTTSWGFTTRSIGAMIMTHGDDNGVIMPPRIAPIHVVIIPFILQEEHKTEVMRYVHRLKEELQSVEYYGRDLQVFVDERDVRSGEKSWGAIKKGIPVRLEIGMRDIEEKTIPLFLRTEEKSTKRLIREDLLVGEVVKCLEGLHKELYRRALEYREANTIRVESIVDFKEVFLQKSFPNKFVIAPFDGDEALEAEIKKDYGVTVRCFPHDQPPAKSSTCLFTKRSGARQAVFATSY